MGLVWSGCVVSVLRGSERFGKIKPKCFGWIRSIHYLSHLANEGERFRIIGRFFWTIAREVIVPHLSNLKLFAVRELHGVSLKTSFDRVLS